MKIKLSTTSSLLVLFLSLFLFPAFVLAQKVSLSGFSASVREADDYFSDVLGDARDFNEICDMGEDEFSFVTRSVAGGVWTGVAGAEAPKIGIGPVANPNAHRAFREDCAPLTAHHPIDSNKYQLFSYSSANSAPNQWGLLWDSQLGFALSGTFAFDGFPLPGEIIYSNPGEFTLKFANLPSLAPADNPWQGWITGLTLWPSVSLPVGGNIQLDWMRLSDPRTGANLNLSWDSSGSTQIGDGVAIYVDTDRSGFDGQLIARELPVNGTYGFNTAILPPGTYYFYTEYQRQTDTSVSVVSRSEYRGPLVINAKPRVKIISPSRTSGFEYSRDELGNPWDMNSSSDILNLDASYNPFIPESLVNGLHGEVFQNGLFIAESDRDPVGGTVDTNIVLNVPADKPIRTNFYRYFCTRVQVDPATIPRDGDPAKLNVAALVSRVVWDQITGDVGLTVDWELTEAEHVFPSSQFGGITYCVDLWDQSSFFGGVPYTQNPTIARLRYDPIEAVNPTKFAIDWVGLFSENYTNSNRQYQIEFELQDVENDSMTVDFFYDSTFFGFGGTRIGSRSGLSSGVHSFNWDATNVPDGTYYIYLIVRDGGARDTRIYSKVPIHVTGGQVIPTPSAKAPCDFNGDGRTDYTVVRYDPPTDSALWIVNHSQAGTTDVKFWGHPSFDFFMAADTLGDGTSDMIAARARLDPLFWFGLDLPSLTPAIFPWGQLGDAPIFADFDGDGRDDYGVFRPADGTWWTIKSAEGAAFFPWGVVGDRPVPADYDGDGRADYAIWRPSDGNWWIVLSGGGFVVRQWGLPGDHPMPGDFTGDGKADLVVWRPRSGNWFVCRSDDNFDCFTTGTLKQWGLPGDHPIAGDFDGDGTQDYAVFRPTAGTWYVQSTKTAQVTATPWGAFGDFPVCMGVADEFAFLGLP